MTTMTTTKKTINLTLGAEFLILLTCIISFEFFINLQIAVLSSFFIIIGSAYAYKKMVKDEIKIQNIDEKRDPYDQLEDPYELYDETPINEAKAEDLDLKAIVKEEKKRIKIFNFQDIKRTEQFKVITDKLSISTINEFKDYYIRNKDDFIKIYKKDMIGDINTNSLVLYSGAYSNIKTTTYSRKKSFSFIQNISGCLYLGDYDAKGKQKIEELEEKYKSFYKEISTIQIPHHGSKHNYNQKLNFKSNIISVISAGINNKFEHPHNETLKQIAIQNGIVILVTEEEETKLTQSIYLREI